VHIYYGPCSFNLAWFLSAGSCKITAADFVKANGYNPDFVGWGYEDTEFYGRLSHLGSELREWHRIPESRKAVAMNLEWPDLSNDEALAWSRRYFGYETLGPLFVPYRRTTGNSHFEQYDKSNDFWQLGQQERNYALWTWTRTLPPEDKTLYIAKNGLNRVRLDRTVRFGQGQGQVQWIKYRTEDVLERMA
jgi:hypothetical protein